MSRPDAEQNLGAAPELNLPITFEEAEAFVEADLREFYRNIGKTETPEEAAIRKEHTFHFIAAKLGEEGETLPVSHVHAENLDGTLRPRVTMPLTSWSRYWALASADRAGIKLDLPIPPRK